MNEIKTILNDTFMNFIISILGILATFICGLLTVYLNRLIRLATEKANSINGDSERRLISDAIFGLDKLINSTVIALNETLVKDIKAMNEDGKLNEDDISEIKSSLIDLVNKQMAPNSKELIIKQISDINSYIDIQAEKHLLELKKRYR